MLKFNYEYWTQIIWAILFKFKNFLSSYSKISYLYRSGFFTARRVFIARTMPWQDVRLSVTRRYCIETAKHIAKLFQRRVATPLVFPYQTSWQYSDGDLITGASNAGGGLKIEIFDQYLALCHSYYGTSVGRPSRIDLSNGAISNDLEWPLNHIWRSRHYLTLNISEAVRDSRRYRHSYNGILIGTYTCSTQGYHFKWPWVILSNLAKYLITKSIARPLCDSRASYIGLQLSVSTWVGYIRNTADNLQALQRACDVCYCQAISVNVLLNDVLEIGRNLTRSCNTAMYTLFTQLCTRTT